MCSSDLGCDGLGDLFGLVDHPVRGFARYPNGVHQERRQPGIPGLVGDIPAVHLTDDIQSARLQDSDFGHRLIEGSVEFGTGGGSETHTPILPEYPTLFCYPIG